MGAWAIIYYMVTTFIAVFIGIVIVIIIQPGKGNRDSPMSSIGSIESVQAADAFLDLIRWEDTTHVNVCVCICICTLELLIVVIMYIYSSCYRNMFPPNLVEACFKQVWHIWCFYIWFLTKAESNTSWVELYLPVNFFYFFLYSTKLFTRKQFSLKK